MASWQRVARFAVFTSAVAAVLATSKGGFRGGDDSARCSLAAGEVKPCAVHACNELQTKGRNYQCSTFDQDEDLGVPDVLTSADLAAMDGLYLYNSAFETFGTQPAAASTKIAEPFWVDIFTDSYLRQDLPQARQLLSWHLPLVDTTPPTFRNVQSGFVYLPISADLRQVLTDYGAVFAINQKSVIDLKATYLNASTQVQSAHTFTLQSQTATVDAEAQKPDGLVITDTIFAAMGRVQAATPAELLPLPVARNFVALYFNEPLAVGLDPATLIAVKQADNDEPIIVGWSVGPDRRAIFGAMVHDDAAFVLTFAKTFLGKSGKVFQGAVNLDQLQNLGITVEVTP